VELKLKLNVSWYLSGAEIEIECVVVFEWSSN